MAWGGERGVVVVDLSRRVLVAALAAAALYGAADPWSRAPAGGGCPGGGGSGIAPGAAGTGAPPPAQTGPDRQRSPSLDQVTAAVCDLRFIREVFFGPIAESSRTPTDRVVE